MKKKKTFKKKAKGRNPSIQLASQYGEETPAVIGDTVDELEETAEELTEEEEEFTETVEPQDTDGPAEEPEEPEAEEQEPVTEETALQEAEEETETEEIPVQEEPETEEPAAEEQETETAEDEIPAAEEPADTMTPADIEEPAEDEPEAAPAAEEIPAAEEPAEAEKLETVIPEETASPARRGGHGYWIHHKVKAEGSMSGYFYLSTCDCSVCGYTANMEKKICHSCGAIMDLKAPED